MTGVLIANRGEIAVRIHRAASALGLRTVAVHSADDRSSAHVRLADEAHLLKGEGVAAYLDARRIVGIAGRARCDLVHPGYGFLSENADFAKACGEAGLTFVGPTPELLGLFGDKASSRALAVRHGVPVLAATGAPTSLAQATEFLAGVRDGVMVKAVAGEAAAACAPCTTRRTSPGPMNAAAPRPSAPSATATSTSSNCCPAPSTSRSRSSGTAPAR